MGKEPVYDGVGCVGHVTSAAFGYTIGTADRLRLAAGRAGHARPDRPDRILRPVHRRGGRGGAAVRPDRCPGCADEHGVTGASRPPLALGRAQAPLPGRHRRRGRARPRHRVLPGPQPRHHRRRRARARLARRRQHGPQHHHHPLQLPVGGERRDLRARAEAVGGARGRAGVPDPVQPARRAQPGPHAAGGPRRRASRAGEPARRRRRGVARPGGGGEGLPDPQRLAGPALSGARRHLPAARRHRQARLRRLGLRPGRDRSRRRHHRALRGDRVRAARRPGDRRAHHPG